MQSENLGEHTMAGTLEEVALKKIMRGRDKGANPTGEIRLQIVSPEDALATADPIKPLLSTLYKTGALDALDIALGTVSNSQLFDTLRTKAWGINTKVEFDAFATYLSDYAALTAALSDEIRVEYARIEGALVQNEERRAASLAEPPLDYTTLGTEVLRTMASRYGISLEALTVADGKDYEKRKRELAVTLGSYLTTQTNVPLVGGLRPGDDVTVVQLLGATGLFSDEREFYHGGIEEDVPLKTKGEVMRVSSPQRFTFSYLTQEGSRQAWELHPDEVEKTGNKYQALLDQAGGDATAAALKYIDPLEEEIKLKYLTEIKGNIERVFNAHRDDIVGGLEQRFGLQNKNIEKLRKQKEFTYKLKEHQPVNATDVLDYQEMTSLFVRAIVHRSGKKVSLEERVVTNEDELREAILAVGKEVQGEGHETYIARLASELAQLLEKQHYLIAREFRANKGPKAVMKGVFERFNGVGGNTKEGGRSETGDKWFRRLWAYSDHKLFLQGDPFAPPSEELLRVAKVEAGDGCDYGKCTFCLEYAGAPFSFRTPDEFKAHVKGVRAAIGDDIRYIERIFIAGGNGFTLPAKRILEMLKVVDKEFNNQRYTVKDRGINYQTRIRRVEMFGRTETITKKSVAELQELVANNLRLVYWGAESGAQRVLDYCQKGTTLEEMYKAAEKVRQAGLGVSLMIMPGLGGIKHYEEHVKGTRDLINAVRPRFTTFHTTTLKPGTDYKKIMEQEMRDGTNRQLTDAEVVEQMYDLVSGLNTNYTTLVATYYPPSAKVAINPVSFRGHLHLNERRDILQTLQEWYSQRGQVPSAHLPDTDYNVDSPLRRMAKEARTL